jgi:hypothetical protein
MPNKLSHLPAALSIPAAVHYSGLSRTFLYRHRHRLCWLKAGRRSLIGRESLETFLSDLRSTKLPLFSGLPESTKSGSSK